jgi:CrcB protein
MNLFFVGVGGFLGSVGRYLLGRVVHQLLHNSTFPYGTMVVNILGCFLIGFFSGLVELRQLFSPEMRLFLLIGLLGGFTTFSTFGYETIALVRDGEIVSGLSNVVIQVIVGLLFVWLGSGVTRYL